MVRHDVERWHLPGRPAQLLLYLTQDLLVVLVEVLEILRELVSLPGILQAFESVSDWDGVQRSDELVPKSKKLQLYGNILYIAYCLPDNTFF